MSAPRRRCHRPLQVAVFRAFQFAPGRYANARKTNQQDSLRITPWHSSR
ncbi:hypothetical protein TTRE_0000938401 [Trichuris trichiura]|uniref:Uncharacterized protein n=1 Tax=Trichuris trichiura TaxID=36087 RepID=A0A077ZKV0_TRITR|nr:hypothetical protein TTRE_0000938401 [Trichuris trichiura]